MLFLEQNNLLWLLSVLKAKLIEYIHLLLLAKTPVALHAAFPSIDRERITNRMRAGRNGSHTRLPHPVSLIGLLGQPPSRSDHKYWKKQRRSSTRSLSLASNAASQSS